MNVQNDASVLPPKVIKITEQKTDSDWFIDPLTAEEVWRQNFA